jgi:prepilin-type processing-associated H-X9-DG protein
MLQCPSGSNHYLYIGEGLTNDASYFPILLEMPGNHRDRVNVGFSDGHVETIAFAEDAAPAQIIEQLVDDEALKAKLLKNLEYYNKNSN